MRKPFNQRSGFRLLVVSFTMLITFGPLVKVQGQDSSRQGWMVGVSDGKSFRGVTGGLWIRDFGGPFPGFMLTGDFDGGGKTDIAGWNNRIKGWHVAISTGEGFDPSPDSGGGFWITGFGAPLAGFMLTGDFNGDRRTDVAGWNASVAGWHVALSTGYSFDPTEGGGGGFWIEHFGGPSPGFMLTGDFNGDGKTDIAGWNDEIKAWHVAISTGHSFDPSEEGGGGFWIGGFGAPLPGFVLTGDFDGDGATDLAGWNEGVLGWHVALSTKRSFDASEAGGGGFWITGFGGPSAGFMLTGNFNGADLDGRNRTDIAGWNEDLQGFDVALSSGRDFGAEGGGAWRLAFGRPLAGFVLVGDFSGDERVDLAAWNPLAKPQPPSELIVVSTTETSARLFMRDHSDVEEGYRIHLRFGRNRETRRLRQPDVTDLLITDLDPDTEYHISISTYNAAGDSPRSEEVAAKTQKAVEPESDPPPPPLRPFFFKVVCMGSIFTYCNTLQIFAPDAEAAKKEAERLNGNCTVTQISEAEFLEGCG